MNNRPTHWAPIPEESIEDGWAMGILTNKQNRIIKGAKMRKVVTKSSDRVNLDNIDPYSKLYFAVSANGDKIFKLQSMEPSKWVFVLLSKGTGTYSGEHESAKEAIVYVLNTSGTVYEAETLYGFCEEFCEEF